MKLKIIDKTGKEVSDVVLNLNDVLRDDIFKKAVISENSLFRQKQGTDEKAGKKVTINLSKRRKSFRTTYGRGGSRTPKKVMWSRGTQFRFVGAFASNTVGGRSAHAPTSKKNIFKDINNKEWLIALKTGVLASLNRELVSKNGQKLPINYPFILNDDFENLQKTKEIISVLKTIGFQNELIRSRIKKVRSGKGTMRSRKYKSKRGPLFIVSSVQLPLFKAVRNIAGFDVITPELLMVSDFGMSDKPGRTILFTKNAFNEFVEVFK